MADEGEISHVHADQRSGQQTILLVEVAELEDGQQSQYDGGYYVGPQRVAAVVTLPEVYIPQNVEPHSAGLEQQRQENENEATAGLAIIVAFHEFDAGEVEQVDEDNGLNGGGGTWMAMKAMEMYLVASLYWSKVVLVTKRKAMKSPRTSRYLTQKRP